MRETCWKPFSYLIIHRQAAQDRLDTMARKGWALEKVRGEVFAKFRRTERTDLKYFVDFADAKPGDPGEEADYRQLCADAGWELAEELGYWNIYASAPGRDPVPIQTDPAEEYDRYRRKVARRSRLSALLTASIMGLYLLSALSLLRHVPHAGERVLMNMLSSTLAASSAVLLLPLSLLWGTVYLLVLWRQLWRWKKDVREGRSLSAPSPRWAGLWGGIKFVFYLASYGFFLLLAPLDCLLNGALNWGVPVGLFLGAALLLGRERYQSVPRFRRRAAATMVLAVVLAVCMVLRAPIRSRFSGRLPMGPILAEFERGDRGERTDGLLGSSVEWWEYVPPAREGDINGLLSVDAREWVSDGLADWAFSLEELEDMEQVSPGLWRRDWDDQGIFLLRRGTRWVRVYWHDLPDRPALEEALERYLEQ